MKAGLKVTGPRKSDGMCTKFLGDGLCCGFDCPGGEDVVTIDEIPNQIRAWLRSEHLGEDGEDIFMLYQGEAIAHIEALDQLITERDDAIKVLRQFVEYIDKHRFIYEYEKAHYVIDEGGELPWQRARQLAGVPCPVCDDEPCIDHVQL